MASLKRVLFLGESSQLLIDEIGTLSNYSIDSNFIILSIKFNFGYFDNQTIMIKQLSQQTSEELCAQQVITTLPDCIKQLVDNSIDAGSTFIKIMLYQYGKKCIEVIDNGCGIQNFDFLGKKGTTSKNNLTNQFSYLGFRGEAIHSIGRVSESMIIESKCQSDGHRRIFDVNSSDLKLFTEERLFHGQFNFQNSNKQGSKSTGTKVTIQNIFKNLPVRHIQLQLKHKQFLKKTNELIKQFSLIYPEIQFIFLNLREGKYETIIETAVWKQFNRQSWLQRIKQLDERIGNSLTYIEGATFQGYVLSKIESGSSRENSFIKKNYHYLFLNRRPIDVLTQIQNTLNQIYKKYNNSTKYAFIINLKLHHSKIDINLTPNKRQIFIRRQALEQILKDIRDQIVLRVIEQIPTFNGFEEKKKGSQSQKKNPYSLQQNDKKNQIREERQTFSHNHNINEGRAGQRDSQLLLNSKTDLKMNVNHSLPQSENKKQSASNKQAEYKIQLSELPKINIDKNRIKEQLNNRLSINFAAFKRISSASNAQSQIRKETTTENEARKESTAGNEARKEGRIQSVDSSQLNEIRKQNQQKKIRQQEEDAKRRAEFFKQVKIQYYEQESKKNKVVVQKQASTKGREAKWDKQQSEKKDEYKDRNVHQIVESDIEQEISSYSRKIEPNDKNLEQRIKNKCNIDMSQVFNKFKNKSYQNDKGKEESEPAEAKQQPSLQQVQKECIMNANQNSQVPNSLNLMEDIQINIQNKIDENRLFIDSKGNQFSVSLKKQHFKSFEIIGQFNKGFILCLFNHQYYLVDQHAASQKQYYQKFLNNSKSLEKINSQQTEQITGIQADQIQQCKQILENAGFKWRVLDRQRLILEKCPLFFQSKLGLQYFWLIVHQKRELQRIPKFTSICAMKACKTAVVVGMPLRYRQMKQIVNNLSDLQSPWNCPHGRPTLVQLGKKQVIKSRVKLMKKYDF